MFIRRTTIKRRESGESYYTYRLVESVRVAAGVRQHTLLNLGRNFEVPRAQWAPLAQRIEALLGGQLDLIVDGLDAQWEAMAQQYAARIVSRRGTGVEEDAAAQGDYQRVDLAQVEVIRPRSVGAEHVALEALRRLGLDRKLEELGFNRHQLSAAIGTIVGRMVQPGSELATHQWLQQRSGLGELLDYDFSALDLTRLYRVSDQLLAHHAALEAYLYQQERDLFSLTETRALYDLTNTFFEGTASGNPKAKRGHSKEKRTDCPLVTLALVLDASGFPKRSEVFAGNVSEPKTLEQMLQRLAPGAVAPTVVLDAGIATEENLAWLTQHGYRYLVVSRERHKQFDAETAILIRAEGDTQIRAQRVVDEVTGEVRLYCHSTGREAKERGIERRSKPAWRRIFSTWPRVSRCPAGSSAMRRSSPASGGCASVTHGWHATTTSKSKRTQPLATPRPWCGPASFRPRTPSPGSTACAPTRPTGMSAPCGIPTPC
jgi:hypothetical protein